MKRLYHTWDKWECFPAGFYESTARNGEHETAGLCEKMYAEFLRDTPRFRAALNRVLAEWPKSCEHYLSNENMNRIAWLGQAAMCIATGIPSQFRGGFNLLADAEKLTANETALGALNEWLESRGEDTLTMETAEPKTKANLY